MIDNAAGNRPPEPQSFNIGGVVSQAFSVMSANFLPFAFAVVATECFAISFIFIINNVVRIETIASHPLINLSVEKTIGYIAVALMVIGAVQDILLYPLAVAYISRATIAFLSKDRPISLPLFDGYIVVRAIGIGVLLYVIYLLSDIAVRNALTLWRISSEHLSGLEHFAARAGHIAGRLAQLLVWGAYWSFAIPLCAIKKSTFIASLAESARITSRYRAKLVTLYLVIIATAFVFTVFIEEATQIFSPQSYFKVYVVLHLINSVILAFIFTIPAMLFSNTARPEKTSEEQPSSAAQSATHIVQSIR